MTKMVELLREGMLWLAVPLLVWTCTVEYRMREKVRSNLSIAFGRSRNEDLERKRKTPNPKEKQVLPHPRTRHFPFLIGLAILAVAVMIAIAAITRFLLLSPSSPHYSNIISLIFQLAVVLFSVSLPRQLISVPPSHCTTTLEPSHTRLHLSSTCRSLVLLLLQSLYAHQHLFHLL